MLSCACVQEIDGLVEEEKGSGSLGTTKKGIGPTYSAKVVIAAVKVVVVAVVVAAKGIVVAAVTSSAGVVVKLRFGIVWWW